MVVIHQCARKKTLRSWNGSSPSDSNTSRPTCVERIGTHDCKAWTSSRAERRA